MCESGRSGNVDNLDTCQASKTLNWLNPTAEVPKGAGPIDTKHQEFHATA